MNKLLFWQDWQRSYRITFWGLLIVFLAFVITILVLQAMGTENLIKWHVLSQNYIFAVDFNNFSLGPFTFLITAYKGVVNEVFSGGELPSTTVYSNILIIIIGLAITLFLSLVTMFNRFWYLVSMGGVLGFLILFHIETLQVFGWTDYKVLILVFIILLTPTYYLHAFKQDIGFQHRVIIIALAMLVLLTIIYFFSDLKEPFTSLLSFGILAPYMLILLFVLTVAHEIVAAFINVISGTGGIENAAKMRHFLIITLIYLVNILLSYLKIAHYIDWQLFYVNPFFLLVISAILGVWGSYSRASLYEGATTRKAVWPMLYLVISITSLATLTFFMLSLNDPFIKVIGDIIIYTHLVVGVAFLLYILYNFSPLVEKGHEIKKVLYNPMNFPFLTFKILSIMGIVALFSVRGFDYPVWYSMAGYNNVKADMALGNGHLDVAEAYYANADAFAYHNHKANYTLGLMFSGSEPLKSMEYFENAIDQQPSAQTVVNLANLKNGQQDYYGGLFALQTGYAKLPGNPHLLNNLAIQFDKLKLIDSAAYYFRLAGLGNPQIRNNRLAFSAQHSIRLKDDSLSLTKKLDRVGMANAAALGVVKALPKLENANHMYDMVLLNNWLLTDNPEVVDGSLSKARKIIDNTNSPEYKDQLLYSWSLAALAAGNINASIDGLQNLAFNSSDWSALAKLALVKIYLQQSAFEQAIELLYSIDKPELNLDLAVALLENGDKEEVHKFWLASATAEDEYLAITAKEILATVYSTKPDLSSSRKIYLYGRYNRYYIDFTEENQLLKKIDDVRLRIELALELASFYHQQDNDAGAIQMLANIEGLELNKNQYRRYLILSALINTESENVQNQLVEFDSIFEFSSDEYLLEYTLNHLAGMELDSVAYRQMATDNPFFAEAILIGANYFADAEDPFKSYEMLAKAVQQNPGSPRLLKAYIIKALDVGLDQFAENALYEFNQKFSSQAYLFLKADYDRKAKEMNTALEIEPND